MAKRFSKAFSLVPRQLIAGLVTIVVILLLSMQTSFFEGLELSAFDAWTGKSLRGTQPPDSRIAIVALDEASLTKFGQWPWDRKVYADLLDRLTQAKAVAFDISWTDPDRNGSDAALAEAIKRSGNVILAAYARNDKVSGKGIPGQQTNTFITQPIKELLDAARGNGHKFAGRGLVNTPTDEDGVMRAYYPVDTDSFGEPFPSLALAAVMKYKGYTPDQIKAASFGLVQVGDLTVDRDRLGQTRLDFYGPAGTVPTYSMAAVTSGKVPPETFKDKIVFIGATADTLHDNVVTPWAKSSVHGATFPGVEVHATAAGTILNGTAIHRAPWQLNALVVALFGLLVVLIATRLKALAGAASTIGLLSAFLVTVYVLVTRQRYWLDSVTPSVAAVIVYTTATVDNYLREQAERRRVKNLFGRYVSHNVVEELLKNPEMLAMGGQRFNVTVLFSDIRGFTSFSETRDPQEVVARINEYCKEMVDLIYKHGGTLDKYMGDGIMAYFGAPIRQEDHAERAMRCAYEMRETMKMLHERWKAQGMQVFKIGVGLNSGEVIAGNIGHPERVEYSLIGATVNLASRLESLTKEYAKSELGGIVFSEETYKLAPKAMEEMHPTDLGEVDIRGMTHKVHIYVI